MNAGKLRHRVELQEVSGSQDSFGESLRTYATYATVWASVEPLQGRELELAQQVSAETNHKITIRYNSNVDTEHRIVFSGRVFELTSVINPSERNEHLVLFCKEID